METPDGETVDESTMPMVDPLDRRGLMVPLVGLTFLVIALGFLPQPFLNVAAGGAGGLLYQETYTDAVLGDKSENSTESHGKELPSEDMQTETEPAGDSK